MLQKIRDRATGPLAWVVVGIICVPFAFFGIEAFRSDGNAGPVAKVGEQEIADAQLQQRYQQRYQQLQQMLGQNFRPDMINPDQLRESVLDGMIQEAANTEYLARNDYRIADEKVLAYVRAQDSFQENGYFSPDLYRDRLARQGINPIQYEDRVRAFLASQQLRQAVSNSAFITDAELAQAWAWEMQTRRYAYRVYKADAVRNEIVIDDAAVQALYEERKAGLTAPERIKLDYVELDPQVLKEAVVVDSESLKSLYEEYKEARFKVAEERKARHILVRASDEAKAAIEAAAQRVAQGEDFAEVAKEISQDPGSKGKGGDLGWVTPGMMVQPFEEALFALSNGEISEPVETQFGWHLIQLEEIRDARIRAFDDAETQAELDDMYRDQKAREQFDALAEQLEQLSFENPTSLSPVTEQLGLEVKTTEWLTRNGGAGIGANDDVISAAFSDLVLKSEENSLPLAVGRRQIVVRLNSHEESRPQTLDEVRSDLLAELTRKAVTDKLQALVDADKALLEAGQKLADLPVNDVAANMPPLTSERTDAVPNRALIGAIFGMSHPSAAQSSIATSGLTGTEDRALIELSEVVDGDWAQAQDPDKSSTVQRLRALRSNQEYIALEAALREQVEIKIYDKSPI
ncbi:MAG: SurA N-terminal domain-containing protein [Oceanococcus sp.]